MAAVIQLHYDSRERFFATDVTMMADNATLKRPAAELSERRTARRWPSAFDIRQPGLGFLFDVQRRAAYPDDVPMSQQDCLDWQGRDYEADFDRLFPKYGHVVYRRKVGGWTQWHLFFLYNRKAIFGFGLHEGDWEMVQAHDDGRVVWARHRYAIRGSWKPSKPLQAFVALGSHALYPHAGEWLAPIVPDVCDGKGLTKHHRPLEVRDMPERGWPQWPGRWGSTRARNEAESWSPESPGCQPRWDPDRFWTDAKPG